MPLDQQLLDAGFYRVEPADLNQEYEYAIRAENDEDAGVIRLSPSDMPNGWWYSQFVPKRSLFHAMMVPIGRSWIQRELSQFRSETVTRWGMNATADLVCKLEWWTKPANGFYKGHPWRPETFSRVYAGNLIPKATVTPDAPNYPKGMIIYLATEPFGVRGSDPRPKPPEPQEQPEEAETVEQPVVPAPPEIVSNEVLIAAFREGKLNIEAVIEQRARAIAAAEVDRATANIPWQVVDGNGSVVIESTAKGSNGFFKRTSKKAEEPSSVLPGKRKIDL